MKKIVFCDIDGTLIDGFRGKFEVSEKTKNAIHKLKETSYFILTSGRAKCMLNESLLELHPDGFILSNGAYIEINEKTIKNRCFNFEQINKIRSYNEKTDNQYLLVNQKQVYSPNIKNDSVQGLLSNLGIDHKVTTAKQINDVNFMIEICTNENECTKFQNQFDNDFKIRRQYQYTAFDINDIKDDKGAAVKQVIEYLKINQKDTYCFGDSNNDVEMMEIVQYPVAMKNAKENIKEKAVFVTEDVLNDGVVLGLLKLGLISN